MISILVALIPETHRRRVRATCCATETLRRLESLRTRRRGERRGNRGLGDVRYTHGRESAGAGEGFSGMLVMAHHHIVPGDGESARCESRRGAQVPFCVMILMDQIKRGALPPGINCRMLVPCIGAHAFSLWEAADTDALAAHLASVPSQTFTLHVVEETGAFGLAEGGGSVLASLEAARSKASSSLHSLDATYHVSEKAAAATHMAREAAREVDSKYKISESCASSWATVKAASASLASQAKAKLHKLGTGPPASASAAEHQPLHEALLDLDEPATAEENDRAFAGLRGN